MNIQTPISELLNDTPVLNAKEITGTNGLARIVLNDQVYTLRITRAGKLILTK